MTDNQLRNAVNSVARGSWQRTIAKDLLRGLTVENPVRFLRGRAKSYTGRYSSSFQSLLARIERHGYTVWRTPGKFGGEYSATYSVEE